MGRVGRVVVSGLSVHTAGQAMHLVGQRNSHSASNVIINVPSLPVTVFYGLTRSAKAIITVSGKCFTVT